MPKPTHTARVVWNIRVPQITALEKVLQEETDNGWMVHTISQPFLREGYRVLVTFVKSELVEGEQAQKLMSARVDKTGVTG